MLSMEIRAFGVFIHVWQLWQYVELVSKELNHLVAIFHVCAGKLFLFYLHTYWKSNLKNIYMDLYLSIKPINSTARSGNTEMWYFVQSNQKI